MFVFNWVKKIPKISKTTFLLVALYYTVAICDLELFGFQMLEKSLKMVRISNGV